MNLTLAEKQRNYRKRLKDAQEKQIVRMTISADTLEIIDSHINKTYRTRAAVIENVMIDWGKA
jgi:hypothetical protein